MLVKEENIYYDYETNKYAIKEAIEKAIDEMTKKPEINMTHLRFLL